MRVVVQRAARASVTVAGEVLAAFDEPCLVVLVGVTHDDGPDQVQAVASKVANLRILRDERSALDAGAPVLVVSQFTLYGDVRKGRRPTWNAAAPGPVAEPLVDAVVETLRGMGLRVGTGRFGTDMAVELVNDGPVTIVYETSAVFEDVWTDDPAIFGVLFRQALAGFPVPPRYDLVHARSRCRDPRRVDPPRGRAAGRDRRDLRG